MTNDWWLMTDDEITFFSSLLIPTDDARLSKYLALFNKLRRINKGQSLLRSGVRQICSIACVGSIASDSCICDRSTTDKCAARFWAQHNSQNYLSNRRSSRKANLANSSWYQHLRNVSNLLNYHPILLFLKVCVLVNRQQINDVIFLWIEFIQKMSKKCASSGKIKNTSKGYWVTAHFMVWLNQNLGSKLD